MKLSMFAASIEAVMLRFALLMVIVIVGTLSGLYWATLLALPLFIMALLAIKVTFKTKSSAIVQTPKAKKALV